MNQHKEYLGIWIRMSVNNRKLKYAQNNLYSHVVGIILHYVLHKSHQGGTNYVEKNFLKGFSVALILVLVAMQNDVHFPK